MSAMDRMPCAYRNGWHHGYSGREPLLPEGTASALTCAINGDAPPAPGFAWAFATHDYKAGYEAGLNDKFWTMERICHPDAQAMRAERAAMIAALPWNVSAKLTVNA